jgi:hypothetical protein
MHRTDVLVIALGVTQILFGACLAGTLLTEKEGCREAGEMRASDIRPRMPDMRTCPALHGRPPAAPALGRAPRQGGHAAGTPASGAPVHPTPARLPVRVRRSSIASIPWLMAAQATRKTLMNDAFELLVRLHAACK